MNRATGSALFKLLIFVVVTLFTGAILVTTISTVPTTGGSSYKAQFTDVTGLQVGDDIRVAGVEVGSVSGIKIVDRKLAQVSFEVTKKVDIRKDVKVAVRYRNLIGQRYLAVTEGDPTQPRLASGSLIPLAQTSPALDLSQLLNGFKPLFQALTPDDVNKLSYEIIQTLQGEGGTIDSLLANTASLTSTIADKDAVIGQVITNLDGVLTTVADRDSQLSDLIDELQRLVTGLAQDKDTIGNSLQGIDDLATATVGFLQPVRSPLKSDIASLNTLSGQLSDTRGVLDKELQILPRKLNTVLRTATYGGWFNFYLCAADGQIILPTGQTVDISKLVQIKGPACNPTTGSG